MIRLSRRALVCAPAAGGVLRPGPALAQRAPQFPPVAAGHRPQRHGGDAGERARRRIGVDVLKRGGNAVDAAVAVGFAMAVTYPRAGNLGGGGFMVIHLAGSKQKPQNIAIDYRETAPAATTRDIFLDAQRRGRSGEVARPGLAIGVPGTVAGLALAHEKYGSGKFTLAAADRAGDRARAQRLPGRRRARGHRPFGDRDARALALDRENSSCKPDGALIARGDAAGAGRSRRDAARRSPSSGPRAFYEGPIADKIVGGGARGRRH